MKTIEKNGRKVKMKERYKNSKGEILPGVTTITSELGWNKGALIHWAWKLGIEQIDYKEFRDDKADIGKLGHQFILDGHRDIKTDASMYSQNQISLAENCLLSYYEWLKNKKVEPILIEKPLISELYQFGGTPDFYGIVNQPNILLDYKTGKGIYPEFLIQVVGGYVLLLEENHHQVDKIIILNIPRAEDENFREVIINDKKIIETCKSIFLNCLEIYKNKKLLKEVI